MPRSDVTHLHLVKFTPGKPRGRCASTISRYGSEHCLDREGFPDRCSHAPRIGPAALGVFLLLVLFLSRSTIQSQQNQMALAAHILRFGVLVQSIFENLGPHLQVVQLRSPMCRVATDARHLTTGGVTCARLLPRTELLQLHGGGCRIGSCPSWSQLNFERISADSSVVFTSVGSNCGPAEPARR